MISYHHNIGCYPCQCECHYYRHSISSLSQQISFQNCTSQSDTIINNRHRNYTSAPYRGNPNRRTGILKINIIICLDRASSIIPKVGSPIWDDLKSRNMIKENIEIPTHSSSTEINEMISNLFPDLNGKRWCLLNSSSCTLKKVPYNEVTCELIKQNLTKTKTLRTFPMVSDIANSFNAPEVSEVSNDFDVNFLS
ncbi:unnamed protein product [Rhizophagus irregularis]|uniref:Uncharacterized protein n=1 Tax=Rhizophagus irregularis TaxID=588596 RepID=A0A915YU96_9GLOM|nr:unnamed protein product [Rhizophagus irregularis]